MRSVERGTPGAQWEPHFGWAIYDEGDYSRLICPGAYNKKYTHHAVAVFIDARTHRGFRHLSDKRLIDLIQTYGHGRQIEYKPYSELDPDATTTSIALYGGCSCQTCDAMASPEPTLNKWGFFSEKHWTQFDDAGRAQHIFRELFAVNYPVFCAPCFQIARNAAGQRVWRYDETNALKGLIALLEAA